MLELIQRNQQSPQQRGLYLYEKFGEQPEFLAYRDFPELVAGAAEFFRGEGVTAGTRVVFPFETSSQVVIAFLALMEIGAVPLSVKPMIMSTQRESYQEFLDKVARDFGAARVLLTPSLATTEPPVPGLPLPPAGARVPGAVLRVPDGEELAFVQFSSGSTSFPKGIPVRQDRLRANLDMITRTDGRSAHERVSSWLPLYHDMGLVGGMLSCFAVGCDLMLAEPVSFLFDARGWWEHMARERAIGTVIPNFAIDYSLRMMQDMEPDELAGLDLSGIRSIYLGSEPINLPNLREFIELMRPTGLDPGVFMPCYGMAEVVLLVSTRAVGAGIREVTGPNGLSAVSVGPPMPEFRVRLRDDEGRLCGEDELGEIELADGSLTDGYLDRTEPLTGPDGYYATGDIGFVNGGELFITGRISDRIKVNGQSLFAADFEQAVERLPFVREGRSMAAQTGGRIIVLAEVDREARDDIPGSRARIVEHLAQTVGVTVHPGDVHYLRPNQLQRTSSGKLQRRAIVAAYEAGRLKGLTFDQEPDVQVSAAGE
ncbi:AMP-binding protein [Kitasatospora viridis]|uniref:Acyl-CoA synthetase (AMP-forming)/AMP-acid ligase II n=1 Tax=Kitasatospora viridis TaxID=281105 RepID=A0A561UJ56_9ACTN|nr:AMP-binding protein [Kitasatospora viridis]TWF99408.1 acyl-CoA synthetase (AMP-forming)/AMP-acid ligase II [Kitasatospora viridis]